MVRVQIELEVYVLFSVPILPMKLSSLFLIKLLAWWNMYLVRQYYNLCKSVRKYNDSGVTSFCCIAVYLSQGILERTLYCTALYFVKKE